MKNNLLLITSISERNILRLLGLNRKMYEIVSIAKFSMLLANSVRQNESQPVKSVPTASTMQPYESTTETEVLAENKVISS